MARAPAEADQGAQIVPATTRGECRNRSACRSCRSRPWGRASSTARSRSAAPNEKALTMTQIHVCERTSSSPRAARRDRRAHRALAALARPQPDQERGRDEERRGVERERPAGAEPSTSAVASAGPANSATVSSVPSAALAGWISSSGTVCGTSPCSAAGRTPRRCRSTPRSPRCARSRRSPVKISTASRACRPKRMRSVVTTTRWRGSRSAHTPPMSRKPTSGTAWQASTMPTSLGVPMLRDVDRERDEHEPVAERARALAEEQQPEVAVAEQAPHHPA